MYPPFLRLTIGFTLLLCSGWVSAQETPPAENEPAEKAPSEKSATSGEDEDILLDSVIIESVPEKPRNLGGSSHEVGEELLEAFEYDNPDSVLRQVPGVYVRSEDGFGLRPNIGLRGGNSERSKKVTLMEDGILFAPAPYSAPAAYYFPMMQRIQSVEVIKGPGSILYGPNTIGGAINLLTRPIPEFFTGTADLAYGLYNTSKAHAHYGGATDHAGFLVEGVWVRSDGFKELDGGGDTGFDKGELMLKGMLRNGRSKPVTHRGDLKITGSIEQSSETYLGLSDADFEANPYRRYRASELDEMNTYRLAGVLGYSVNAADKNLTVQAYHTTYQRGWNKVSSFASGGASLAEVLADPTTPGHAPLYDILRGETDSSGAAESLMVGLNARSFSVQGLDTQGALTTTWGPLANSFRLGTRIHHDRIQRDHSAKAYEMIEGSLERLDLEKEISADTDASSLAVSSFLSWEMVGWGLSVVPGVRHEWIDQSLTDNRSGETRTNGTQVLLFGLGTHYQLTENFGLLAGAHQGFSPTAPGQDDSVQSERSINYEAGFRYKRDNSGTAIEAIGFLNNYTNMVAQCSLSVGCAVEDLDKEYNAGEVDVYGVETLLSHRVDIPGGMFVPLRATYTWTDSAFQSEFISGNPQLGTVEEGDQLPYLPTHQASSHVGIAGLTWGMDVGVAYVSPMREEAGSSADDPMTDAIFHLDASGRYSPVDWAEIYLKGENLTASTPVASRRPYGARPGKPLLIMGGAKLFF